MKDEFSMLSLIFAAISICGMFISMDIRSISDELKDINETLKKLKGGAE